MGGVVYSLMASKTVHKKDDSYCPKDKMVRMKSIYVRSPRQDGQKWLSLGRICPVCQHQEIDATVLTSGY